MFLSINKNNSFSFLQETALRTNDNKYFEDPIIVCNEEHRFIVAEQMREINVDPNSIILEPLGRNTAPAIALAALKSLKDYKDPTLLILSSDHKIDDEDNFRKVIEKGMMDANNGRLVTFGVIPTSPETGYGYIETHRNVTFETSSNPNTISWLHIDLNSSMPTLKCLDFFYEKLETNGIIIFDDYGWKGYEDTKEVIDIFLNDKKGTFFQFPTGQAVFLKK